MAGLRVYVRECKTQGLPDETIRERLLDFGFEPEEPVAGEAVSLSFSISAYATREATTADSLWLRISDEQGVIFATTLALERGSAVMTYTFPHGGEYTIRTRFFTGENLLAETDFAVPVEGEEKDFPFIAIPVALTALALAALALSRFKRK